MNHKDKTALPKINRTMKTCLKCNHLYLWVEEIEGDDSRVVYE